MLTVVLSLVIIGLVVVLFLRESERRKAVARYELLLKDQKQEPAELTDAEKQFQEMQSLSEERKNIISIVSHDLKSPLNRTYALIRLLSMEADNLTEEQKGYLSKMHQVIADGLNLVRNMLDIRAIQDRGIVIHKERINISNFIQSELNQYKVLADLKELKMIAEITPDIFANIDRQYLGRIMDNLLSNAIKFSPYNMNIWIALKQEDGAIILTIKDEGPGFLPEELPRMFEKYQKFSAKPTGGESSTGLGLSIAKDLADGLGYKLSCQSEPGKGSVFKLELVN
ncbi:MAG TPA: HAMP domain-containing sensor histidine kinase [Cyclobacteriaceae bacterium]|nr:HAMP domain-containing sensor histidine kinase [Cyclobacteriaceae bacterium]